MYITLCRKYVLTSERRERWPGGLPFRGGTSIDVTAFFRSNSTDPHVDGVPREIPKCDRPPRIPVGSTNRITFAFSLSKFF